MKRPLYISGLHAIGVVLSIGSFLILLIGQIRNPGILFCLAVAIMIGLEVYPGNDGYSSKTMLHIVYGNIVNGGIRRGIFIKEIFTVAIFWLTIATYFFYHDFTSTIANGILTFALIISVIANEIEAKIIKKEIGILI